MNPDHKKYILENMKAKSPAQIAAKLGLRERNVKNIIQIEEEKDPLTAASREPQVVPLKKAIILVSIILIIILGFAVYANSLNGKFIFDDEVIIKSNTFIRNPLEIGVFFTNYIFAVRGQSSIFYRPLQMVSYALDYAVWKLNATGYHITNMLLHILVALCIYWMVNILYNNNKLSFLTSALFAVHPIHTEAVSYISGRADSLSALFMLLCFIIYIKQIDRNRINMPDYILLLSVYTFALLSKEISMILPLLLLFYHFVFRKKIKVLEFVSLLGILAAYLIIRLTCLKSISSPPQVGSDTMLDRIPGFFVAILSYIKLLFLPFPLHMEYGTRLFEFTNPKAIMGIIITIAILAFAYLKRNNRIILFSVGWFFLTLLPVSNLYKINAYMYEHFLYLPSIGFFLLIAYLLTIIYNDKRYKVFGSTLMIISLLFYSALTIRQNNYWKEPFTFYDRTIKLAPDSAIRAYIHRGILYKNEGNYDQAISDYNRALQLNPDFAVAYSNRGIVYAKKGNYDQAISDYSRAIQINVNYAEAYNNRGNAYNCKKEYNQAVLDFTKAIQLNPDFAMAYANRAIAYYYNNEFDNAWTDVDKAELLNYKVTPQMLEALKKASGREN